jgi:hypothetical protein
MTADIFFPNVEWYGATSGQRIRVKVGEKFRIALTAGASGTWATTNDPVFAVSEFGPGILEMSQLVKDLDLKAFHNPRMAEGLARLGSGFGDGDARRAV